MPSNSLTHAAFEFSKTAKFVLNPDGKIVLANKSARRLAPTDEPFQTEKARRFLAMAVGTTSPSPFRLEINGVDCNASMSRLAGVKAPMVLAVIEKHAAAVKIFEELNERLAVSNAASRERRQRSMLQQDYEELDRFSSIAAHDLNAPLRQIGQVLTLLRLDMEDRLQPEDIRQFELIENRTSRLRGLINALLSYSRTMNAPLNAKPVNLKPILQDVAEDLAPLIKEKNAKFSIGDLPVIEADPILTQQLFQNLVANALKYSREGVNPVVEVTAHQDGNRQVIAVADNGIGVTEEMASRIFEPFVRVGEKKDEEGTGIGLSIVKMVAAKHNWTIAMTSEPGAGSTINITVE